MRRPATSEPGLKMFLVLLPDQFLPSENTQTDSQIMTKRHNERKYIHIHAVMLINTSKNFENMHKKTYNYNKK